MDPLAHMSQPPNGISIGYAVFEYTAAKTPNVYQWGGQPPKLPLFLGISAPPI